MSELLIYRNSEICLDMKLNEIDTHSDIRACISDISCGKRSILRYILTHIQANRLANSGPRASSSACQDSLTCDLAKLM